MDFKVNINEKVKVKLTDIGIEVLKDRRNELNKMIKARGGKSFGEYELKTDKEGYTQFQLWELMDTFGSLMAMGFQLPFDSEIIITKGKPLDDQSV